MSEAVSESITVKAGPDAVMDVIADFETYPEWQDEIKDVKVLETDEDGWGITVRYTVDAKVFSMTYVLAYTYTDDAMHWTLVESDQLRKIDGTYHLKELDDGSTLVTYDLEVVPAITMPKMVRRKAAQRIVDGALKGMKQRVESLT